MPKRPAPSSAPSTPAAGVVAHPASAAPSEVTTVHGSDDDEGALSLSLLERAPDIKVVIKSVMDSHAVTPFFDSGEGTLHDGDRALFLGEGAMALWNDIGSMLLAAIEKHKPQSERDLPKKTAAFEKYKQHIIGEYSLTQVSHIVGEDVDRVNPRFFMMVTLLSIITAEYVKTYLKMISPPSGEGILPITKQVDDLVALSIGVDAGELFQPHIARRVYYVIGFLCNAGSTASPRRSAASSVGDCIAALKEHFHPGRDKDAVLKIKADLPSEVASLVDERCYLGGLKYPDRALYVVFGVCEIVFSSLTTSNNFTYFGGTLVSQIRDALTANESVQGLFKDLYHGTVFDDATISSAFGFYLQVFINVRAKDLVYRYNSNILKKSTEQGLRQSLAGAVHHSKRNKKPKPKEGEDVSCVASPEEENESLMAAAEVELDDGDKIGGA